MKDNKLSHLYGFGHVVAKHQPLYSGVRRSAVRRYRVYRRDSLIVIRFHRQTAVRRKCLQFSYRTRTYFRRLADGAVD